MLRRIILVIVVICLGGLGGAYVALSDPIPVGQEGPEAEAKARLIEQAINKQGWDKTGAIEWVFAGKHHHRWDRQRQYSEVRWGEGAKETVVQFRIEDPPRGLAKRGSENVTGDELNKLLKEGYAKWVNDSFWLNPLAKLFDPGTRRLLVTTDEDGAGLMIQYTSGGLTPGDSYFYVTGPENLPRYWRMWVSIIPVGGVKTTFDKWITLETGAKISTYHDLGPRVLELTQVRGAATLMDLSNPDPFAELATLLGEAPRP